MTENRLKMQLFLYKRFTWQKCDFPAVESLAVFKNQIEDLKLYNVKLMNRIEFLESTLSISKSENKTLRDGCINNQKEALKKIIPLEKLIPYLKCENGNLHYNFYFNNKVLGK